MDGFKTPLKCNKKMSSVVYIPPSPQMKKIGCGTGLQKLIRFRIVH